MNVTTPQWQLLLLAVLAVGLGGILWWRLQPPPPSPVLPPPKPHIQATLDHPLHSRLIPEVTFLYPAERVEPDPANSGGRIDYLKVNGQTCEQFTWDVPYLNNAAEIARRYYKQIRSLGVSIIYTDPTPIPLPPPDPGQKKLNFRIEGQDPYVEFLFKDKRYASFIRFAGGFNMLICSSAALYNK